MSLTFPLALPSTGIKSVVFRGPKLAGVTRSIYTASRQVSENSGEFLEVDVTLKPMKRPTAEAWVATLLSLRGPVGTFLLGDPSGIKARGTVAGSLIVSGGSQVGSSLVTSGGTGTLLQGDWVQIGTGTAQRIYKCVKDVSLGVGAVVEIFPRLRESPANSAAITYANCKGVFALVEGGKTSWSIDEAIIYGISFQATEAI